MGGQADIRVEGVLWGDVVNVVNEVLMRVRGCGGELKEWEE